MGGVPSKVRQQQDGARLGAQLVWLACCLALLASCGDPSRQIPSERTCLSCHDVDRQRPKFPDHLAPSYPTDCQQCHTQKEWVPAAFEHTALPLKGAHSKTDCASCHAKEPVPTKCVGCHEADRARGPGHTKPGFSSECQNCHSVSGWKPATSVDHSKFPFEGGHSDVACATCHTDPKNPATPIGTKCVDCHAKDKAKPKDPDHTKAGFPTTCETCHTIQTWKTASFPHAGYPLIGRHKTAACASCHTDPAKPETAKGSSCAECHAADRPKGAAAGRPDHFADGLPPCQYCHSSNGWKPAAKDHSKFPLTGKHGAEACTSCHTDASQPNKPTSTTCVGCHEPERSKPTLPDHRAAGFPTECARCHTTNAWKPGTFDHTKHLPLTGGHSGVACANCHRQSPVPKTCTGCHRGDAPAGATAARPDHKGSGFSTICSDCHNTDAWKPAAFDHTKFPFQGGHADVACASCHTDAQNPGTPKGTTCFDCHASDRSSVTNPDHDAPGFPTTCQTCHTIQTWKSASFPHAKFPLIGKHTSVNCSSCHIDPTQPQTAKGSTCAQCHAADRPTGAATATGPDHYAVGLPGCQVCHSSNGWKPAVKDHSKFPLTGKHGGVACASCHTDATQPTKAKATTCVGCHESERSKPTLPDHRATGFSTACQTCHTTAGWKPATFDHTQYLPLTGGHSGVACANCHAQSPVPKTCGGCHQSDVPTGTTSARPDHKASGFSSACGDCHSATGWKPAAFDHTKFPFEGGHASVACASCHVDPSNPSTPTGTSCFDCHASDRSKPTTPDHLDTAFPTTCQTCHTIQTWKSATFPHAKFPLIGKHTSTACGSCHIDPTKPATAKGTTCAECHAADRPTGSTSARPDHFSQGLPGCDYCHTSNGWKPAVKDHSKFPLTGKHGGTACTSCHTNASQPSQVVGTTCVACHDGDRSKPTYPNHLAVGFSTDCKSCHTTISFKPATFDHGQVFALTGGHSGVACANCHAQNPVPKTCVGCHVSKIPVGATAARPDHKATNFSTACNDCHNTTAWKPATFDHTKFPLTQAHTSPACSDCHVDPTQPSVPKGTTCTQCHLANRPPAGNNPDHLVSGFPTACQDCHTPTVWTNASFDHSVYLPLTGAHSAVACALCHSTTPVPKICEGCHNPPAQNHTATTACDSCHTVNAWKPAVVDHSKFPLTGRHASLLCNQCHTDPSKPSVPTATTCVGCHNADRSTPVIPNHLNSFPTDCASCHTTSGWRPATFAHTFPIDSGKHRNKPCGSCHLDPSNTKIFSCLGTCHEHTISKMDDKHKSRNGYISGDYPTCLNCHADGRK